MKSRIGREEERQVHAALGRLADEVDPPSAQVLSRMAHAAARRRAHPEGRRASSSRRRLLVLAATLALLPLGVSTAIGVVNLLVPEPQSPGGPPGGRDTPAEGVQGNLLRPSWTFPRPGWIYVLDPNNLRLQSQLLLVDPQAGRVRGAIRLGYDPAFALSPDGSRLYVASSTPEGEASLSVIDTATGKMTWAVPVEHRMMNTSLPQYPTLAVSPDGGRVYVRQMRIVAPGQDRFTIATFDTASGAFLPEVAHVEHCGTGPLFPYARQELVVLCGHTNDARFLHVNERGLGITTGTVSLPTVGDGRTDENGNPLEVWRFSGGALSPDGSTLYVVTQAGKRYVIDVRTRALVQTGDLTIPSDQWITPGRVALSPDGTTLYVGVGPLSQWDRSVADQVYVVASQNAAVLGRLPTTESFWSLAVGPSGDIFAMSPPARLLVLDPAAGRQTKVIASVGETPAQAVVAPAG